MTVIKEKDLMKQFNARMKELMERDVLVGIPRDSKKRKKVKNKPPEGKKRKKTTSSDGDVKITNAEIGFINNFGSPAQNIPATHFMEGGLKTAKSKIVKALKLAVIGIEKENAVEIALNNAGSIARDAIKRRIVQQKGMPPLSPKTIAIRKNRLIRPRDGLMKRLIDSSQFIGAITYIVDD